MRLRSQKLSEVPPDVWRTIARATLAAEGDGLAAWARLSTVSRAWREHLADAPIVAEFDNVMSPEQRESLRTSRARVRRLSFHVSDGASAALLHDTASLAASESTLEEAEGIHVSAEACLYEPLPALISMARFTALRSLVLRQACGFALSTGTPQLPPSLGDLVFDYGPGFDTHSVSAEAPANLDLSALTVLTRLELRGYDCNVVQIRLMGLRMQERQPQMCLPASLRVLRIVTGHIDLSHLVTPISSEMGSLTLELEAERGTTWDRGMLMDESGLVGNLTAGYGELRLRTPFLLLLNSRSASTVGPRPQTPSAALAEWLQAAPSILRRCRLYVRAHEEQRDVPPPAFGHALHVALHEDAESLEALMEQCFDNAGDLFAAACDSGAACGVTVTLEEDDRCVVFDRA